MSFSNKIAIGAGVAAPILVLAADPAAAAVSAETGYPTPW